MSKLFLVRYEVTIGEYEHYQDEHIAAESQEDAEKYATAQLAYFWGENETYEDGTVDERTTLDDGTAWSELGDRCATLQNVRELNDESIWNVSAQSWETFSYSTHPTPEEQTQ